MGQKVAFPRRVYEASKDGRFTTREPTIEDKRERVEIMVDLGVPRIEAEASQGVLSSTSRHVTKVDRAWRAFSKLSSDELKELLKNLK